MKKSIIAALAILATIGMTSCGESEQNTNTDNNESSQSTARKLTITVTGTFKTAVGYSVSLNIRLKNDSTKAGYTVESSDESIATVTDAGVVTGVGAGTCTITVASVADPSVKKEIEFTVVDTATASVDIEVESTSMKVGNTLTLKALVTNGSNSTVTYKWKSGESLGTFNKSTTAEVVYTAKKVGTDTITLTCSIGEVEVAASVEIEIAKNDDNSIKISSADEFKSTLLTSGRKEKDYVLTADIDLGGYKIDGYKYNTTFAGHLNGNGHKVSNFEIISTEAKHANSGMFRSISSEGVIEDVEFDGSIGVEGVGWGSAILANEVSGTVRNCLFKSTQTYNNGSDEWFPFGGSIAGVLKESAVLEDCVVDVSGEGKDVHMAFAIYPAGGHQSDGTNSNFAASTQTFTCSGLYTSQAASLAYGSAWEWGGPIENTAGIHSGINFSTASKSTYSDLSEDVWNLQDNAMPTLKVVA